MDGACHLHMRNTHTHRHTHTHCKIVYFFMCVCVCVCVCVCTNLNMVKFIVVWDADLITHSDTGERTQGTLQHSPRVGNVQEVHGLGA
jgi:hypothetical protein